MQAFKISLCRVPTLPTCFFCTDVLALLLVHQSISVYRKRTSKASIQQGMILQVCARSIPGSHRYPCWHHRRFRWWEHLGKKVVTSHVSLHSTAGKCPPECRGNTKALSTATTCFHHHWRWEGGDTHDHPQFRAEVSARDTPLVLPTTLSLTASSLLTM